MRARRLELLLVDCFWCFSPPLIGELVSLHTPYIFFIEAQAVHRGLMGVEPGPIRVDVIAKTAGS